MDIGSITFRLVASASDGYGSEANLKQAQMKGGCNRPRLLKAEVANEAGEGCLAAAGEAGGVRGHESEQLVHDRDGPDDGVGGCELSPGWAWPCPRRQE